MKHRISIIDPCGEPRWDSSLEMLPGATIFHTAAWARVLADAYGYRPVYALLEDSDGPAAMIPLFQISSVLNGRRAVALPFSDHCEPLARSADAFHRLWQWLLARGAESGWKYLELRGGAHYLGTQVPFQQYVGHHLNLAGSPARLRQRLKPAVRRNIKRAIKEDVAVTPSASLIDLRHFYDLHCLTRKRHGLPPQPWRFFRAIHQHLLARGHGHVWLARWRGRVIASAVYFHFGGNAIFKYGASDYEVQSKRGNDAVMWRAICWCREHGFETLYFGRTGRDNFGLRRYKSGWGTAEKTLRYYRYRLDRHRYVTGNSNDTNSYARVLHLLPVPVLRAIGEVLYKEMG